MADKDAYIRNLRERKEEWNAEIDKLTAKANKAETELRDAFRKQLENLQKKCKEAEQLYANKWTADGRFKEDLKSGVQNACDTMEAALRAARRRLK